MEDPITKLMNTKAYVADVSRLVSEGVSVRDACAQISELCCHHHRFAPPYTPVTEFSIAKFQATLKRAYFRSLKGEEKEGEYHGNSVLTKHEENVLVGFVKGLARRGYDMDEGSILLVVSDMFPDRVFGNHW